MVASEETEQWPWADYEAYNKWQHLEDNPPRLMIQAAEDFHRRSARTAIDGIAHVGFKQPYYTYEPLTNETHSFRLVRFIHEGCLQGEIACELSNHLLSRSIRYQALSYEWGNANEHSWISVNGHRFRISRNLFEFLKNVRATIPAGTWIFADAICIDQSNIRERNTQVDVMGRIYSGASCVLCWIGPSASLSEELYQFFRAAPSLTPETLRNALVTTFNSPDPQLLWDAIIALADRSYWSRMWIVQEILLANDIAIYCGTWRISWDELEYLLALMTEIRNVDHAETAAYTSPLKNDAARLMTGIRVEDLEPQLQQCRIATYLSHRRVTYGSPLVSPMIEMIESYGRSACSDVRDRIYGLLGVARASYDGSRLVPDYAQNEVGLFVDVLQCYQVAFPVRFGSLLNELLCLESTHTSRSPEEFIDHVNVSTHGSTGSQAFEVELAYSGQVTSDALSITAQPDEILPPTKMYSISHDAENTGVYLFTTASVQKDDHVVRILHSEYVFLYRVTIADKEQVPEHRIFDAFPWQERQLIGRGVLLPSGSSALASQFLRRGHAFCLHESSSVFESISYGRRATISTSAPDMIIITTRLGTTPHEEQKDAEPSLPRKRQAPTDHADIFTRMTEVVMGEAGQKRMDRLLRALDEHRHRCNFKDCTVEANSPFVWAIAALYYKLRENGFDRRCIC